HGRPLGGRSGWVNRRRDRDVALDRPRLPGDVERAGRPELDLRSRTGARLGGDENGSAVPLLRLLDVRRDVDRVADRRVLAAPRRADVADDDAARMDADPHAQRRLAARRTLAVQAV